MADQPGQPPFNRRRTHSQSRPLGENSPSSPALPHTTYPPPINSHPVSAYSSPNPSPTISHQPYHGLPDARSNSSFTQDSSLMNGHSSTMGPVRRRMGGGPIADGSQDSLLDDQQGYGRSLNRKERKLSIFSFNDSSIKTQLLNPFVLTLAVLLIIFIILAVKSPFGQSRAELEWQRKYDEIKMAVMGQEKHDINLDHHRVHDLVMEKASLYEKEKVEAAGKLKQFQETRDEAQKRLALVEQSKLELERKWNKLETESRTIQMEVAAAREKLAKDHVYDIVDGKPVWRPKLDNLPESDHKTVKDTPKQHLDTFEQHNKVDFQAQIDLTADSNLSNTNDERSELSKEIKDGTTHQERVENQQSNGIRTSADDPTLAAAYKAAYKENMRGMEAAEQETLMESEDKQEDEKKPVKKADPVSDVTPASVWSILPHSSVWCTGDSRTNRICKFRNICYKPSNKKWFILQTNRTTQQHVPIHRYADDLLELTTIENHSTFYWNFDEVNPYDAEFRNIKVRYENDLHFVFARLHPDNVMHNLHDDALGLYYLIQEYVGGGSSGLDMAFSLHTHRLLIYDDYDKTKTSRVYDYFSNSPPRFSSYLNTDPEVITCFRDAVFGNTKIATWYQYGFKSPQGPIPNKVLNGNLVREVAEWFIRRQGLPLGEDEKIENPSADPVNKDRLAPVEAVNGTEDDFDGKDASVDFRETDLIVILSRKYNRLILNEKELASHLGSQFSLEVKIVSNEEHNFEEQIKFMRRARIVVGMHGSIMIMGMFCRRGTVMIEMFPFAVPPENYTPYKTMAEMTGMDMVYRAWVNRNETASVGHPKRHKLHGGLEHLSEQERKEVLDTKTVPVHICCSSPYWLYRIYQDTRVDLSQLTELIQDALIESRKKLKKIKSGKWNWAATEILPPAIDGIRCLDGTGRKPGELWAEWSYPWNKARVDKFSIHINNNAREYVAISNSMAIEGFQPGEEVIFFVRPIVGSFKGEFSRVGRCKV